MKLFVIDVKKIYPVAVTVKIFTVFSALVLSCVFVLYYVLGAPLYIEAVSRTESEKLVIVDAGHGGEDSGAIGKNGVFEKALNLEMANCIAEELKARGYNVILTRTEDKMLYSADENIKGIRKISDLKNRVRIAEENPGAIFLSVHMNAYSSERFSGFQAYYNGNDPESRALAETVQKNVRERLQPENDRVIKDGKELYLLKNSPTVTVLLECGFISNEEECEKLCEKEYQKELSFAIICGIIEYIG